MAKYLRTHKSRALSALVLLTTVAVGLPTAATAAPSCSSSSVSVGARGACVTAAQRYLGIRADGVFGPSTKNAAVAWQRAHGIKASGIVGPLTWASFVGKAAPVAAVANNAIPAQCAKYAKAGVVCASKASQKLWFIKDGRVQMTLAARFGSRSHPTRNGVFAVTWKAAKYRSKTYDSDMPFAMFYDGGRAVHFSGAFARGDNGPSHGCIRLRDYNGAGALFAKVSTGTRVVVF